MGRQLGKNGRDHGGQNKLCLRWCFLVRAAVVGVMGVPGKLHTLEVGLSGSSTETRKFGMSSSQENSLGGRDELGAPYQVKVRL